MQTWNVTADSPLDVQGLRPGNSPVKLPVKLNAAEDALLNALKSGVIGAVALNLVHESARKLLPNSPRVDVIGMRAMQRYILDPLNVELDAEESTPTDNGR